MRGVLPVLLVLLASIPVRAQTRPDHVVLVAIDGLRPVHYLEPDRFDAKVPNLRALVESGSHAEAMISVFPSLTYPAHASLVTGADPAKHGVVTNRDERGEWFVDASAIRIPTLWDAARSAGLRTAVVTWPSTYGAEVDFRIPENLASSPVRPLADLIREGSTPGLFEELAGDEPVDLPPFRDPDSAAPMDAMTARFAAELFRLHRPNLLLLHFLDLDHQEHFHGLRGPEVTRALETTDAHLGRIREAIRAAGAEESTLIVVVGDHGFVPLHTTINVLPFLDQVGLVPRDSTGLPRPGPVRVASGGGSAAFYLRQGADPEIALKVTGVMRAVAAGRFRGLLEWLTPDDLTELGAHPGAIGAVVAAPGYLVAAIDRVPGLTLLPTGAYRGMHGYRPTEPGMETGFVASGPGIRSGIVIPRLRMIDVAPTLATILGLRLPEATGLPVVGLLDLPAAPPPTLDPPAPAPSPAPRAGAADGAQGTVP